MPAVQAPTLLWFRRDLRLADNAAVAMAAGGGGAVIPVFVLDEAMGRPLGGASRWWLDRTLAALARDLERAGSRLILLRGPADKVIPRLAAETGARRVLWNRVFEPAALGVDAAVRRALNRAGVEAQAFKDALLGEPGALLNGQGRPYQVFSAYWKAARAGIGFGRAEPRPARLPGPEAWPASERLVDWGLHPARASRPSA